MYDAVYIIQLLRNNLFLGFFGDPGFQGSKLLATVSEYWVTIGIATLRQTQEEPEEGISVGNVPTTLSIPNYYLFAQDRLRDHSSEADETDAFQEDQAAKKLAQFGTRGLGPNYGHTKRDNTEREVGN